MAGVLEIEFGNDKGQDCLFYPALSKLRGKLDFVVMQQHNPEVGKLYGKFQQGIPGQRVRIDPERGEAFIIDPLSEPQHDATRKTIKELIGEVSFRPARDRKELRAEEVPTWLYWMRRAVEAGAAKVTEGRLPDDAACAGARKRFFSNEPPPNPLDLLAQLLRVNIMATIATMTDAQRKTFEKLRAEGVV